MSDHEQNNANEGQSRAAEGEANLTDVLAVTVDELRIICDTTVRLAEIRQRGCSHLCVENFAPEAMRKLLLALKMHKQGFINAEDLGALGATDFMANGSAITGSTPNGGESSA